MNPEEPSVLDYLKAKLFPWKKSERERIEATFQEAALAAKTEPVEQVNQPVQAGSITTLPSQPAAPAETAPAVTTTPRLDLKRLPWRSLTAIFLALAAQFLLEPKAERPVLVSLFLYGLSAGWLFWAFRQGEWRLADPNPTEFKSETYAVRRNSLLASLVLIPLAFLAFGNNRFTSLNVLLWVAALAASLHAFWQGPSPISTLTSQVRTFLQAPELKIRLSRQVAIAAAVIAVILFFRLYQLNQVPQEMTSDHAEKLLDVWDVLNGTTPIFFVRNTGREPLQFYLTALVAQLFGTGISFLSLKIGTTLAGLVTIFYVYRLGKEWGNREVGTLAALMAGMAYWLNLTTRIALRFTFYPMATAMSLYYLLRGLQRANRNDLILAGIALGIGLHTYSPTRALVLVLPAALLLFSLHQKDQERRKQAVFGLGIIAYMAFVVFLPLVRFAMQFPDLFFYRMLTRVGTIEQPFPGPVWQVFLSNLWRASTMFFWDNGEIWTISLPHRPALDVISAGLFFIGLLLLVIRYLRQRNWMDLFLLISIPLLMLSSTLALAFPAENPALNRTSGAAVPVFLIIGLALQSLLRSIREQLGNRSGQRAAWGIGLALLLAAGLQNYRLVFDQYRQLYDNSSWNSSEVGKVIRGFADSIGSLDSAWVIPYPYWMDTRLVGMNAGNPTRDYALFPDQIESTLNDPRAKLFIFKLEDQQTFERLSSLYPEGRMRLYLSRVPTKEFWIFAVLPQQNPGYNPTP